jgi:hypothetical protein
MSMYVKVRSYAVAIFIVGHGIMPIDAVLVGGNPVFRFPIEADDLIDSYASARAKVDGLARAAKPVEVSR